MKHLYRLCALLFAVIFVLGVTGCPQATEDSLEPQDSNQKAINVKPTYTVTYVDGVTDADITVPKDENLYHIGDTVTVKFDGIGTREGYTFTGWSDGKTTYTKDGTSTFTMRKADVILTAQWQIIIPTYTVTYADGVEDEEIDVPEDTTLYHTGDTVTVKFDEIGTRDGYTFAGWSDGITTYTADETTSFTMEKADVVLTAQWEVIIPTYTVIYDDGVEDEEIDVPEDATLYHEEDDVTVKFDGVETREGYIFTGWSDGTTTYKTDGTTSFTIKNADVILTAQWQEFIPDYTVTYTDGVDDEEIAVPADITLYHAGDTVTVKFNGIGARDGYTFAGWSDGTTTYKTDGTTSFTMANANVILTAQWEVIITTYTVTYADGVEDEEITVPSDSTLYNPGNTVAVKFNGIGTRDGYTFAGWSDGATIYTNTGITSFTMGNKNVTLTAQWRAYYTITYVDDVAGEEITVPSDTKLYYAGDIVHLKFDGIGTRDHYTFEGWSDGTTTYKTDGTTSFTMGNKNVTLTAQWERYYTVTYVDGVEGVEISVPVDTNKYHTGDPVTIQLEGIGTRDHYSFIGWKYETFKITGSVMQMRDFDVTLTADWIPYYTVTYVDGVDDAEISVPEDTEKYYYGNTVTAKFDGIGKRNGYFFGGWSDGTDTYTDKDDGTKSFQMRNADITLTAQWIPYIGTKGPDEARAVGDIIFKDGTATPYSENLTLTADQKNAAIAIIFYTGTGNPIVGSNVNILGKKALGVALTDSSTETPDKYTWVGSADLSSEAFRAYQASEYYLSDGITLREGDEHVNLTVPYYKFDGPTQMDGHFRCFFYGDMDGSDNTETVRELDSSAVSNPTDAFTWVINYGQNHGITGTYSTGWYLPTLTELRILYDNKELMRNVFEKTGKTDPFVNPNSAKKYWTSNKGTDDNTAFSYDIGYTSYTTGIAGSDYQSNENYVLCIRQF